jgi:hypothetical protein
MDRPARMSSLSSLGFGYRPQLDEATDHGPNIIRLLAREAPDELGTARHAAEEASTQTVPTGAGGHWISGNFADDRPGSLSARITGA